MHPNQAEAMAKIKAIEAELEQLVQELKERPEFNTSAFYTAQYEFTTGFMWLKRGVDQFS